MSNNNKTVGCVICPVCERRVGAYLSHAGSVRALRANRHGQHWRQGHPYQFHCAGSYQQGRLPIAQIGGVPGHEAPPVRRTARQVLSVLAIVLGCGPAVIGCGGAPGALTLTAPTPVPVPVCTTIQHPETRRTETVLINGRVQFVIIVTPAWEERRCV